MDMSNLKQAPFQLQISNWTREMWSEFRWFLVPVIPQALRLRLGHKWDGWERKPIEVSIRVLLITTSLLVLWWNPLCQCIHSCACSAGILCIKQRWIDHRSFSIVIGSCSASFAPLLGNTVVSWSELFRSFQAGTTCQQSLTREGSAFASPKPTKLKGFAGTSAAGRWKCIHLVPEEKVHIL